MYSFAALNDAQRYLGTTHPLAVEEMRDTLTDTIHTFTDSGETHTLCCVDGAVAHVQTDVLCWIAFVAGTSHHGTLQRGSCASPVGVPVDRVGGAAMALAEMTAALQASETAQTVWMDGGLATPLVSLSTGLTAPNPAVSDLVCRTSERGNIADVLEGYLSLATSGRLRALPKQDTATSFTHHWSGLTRSEENARWVRSMNDRTMAGRLLNRGEFLAPRPAVEALRVRVKPVAALSHDTRFLVDRLSPLFAAWRSDVSAWVLYAQPHKGTGRPVKVEFTTRPGEDPQEVGYHVAEQAAGQVRGSQIVEPLPQYLVDTEVKKAVTSELNELMGEVEAHFGRSHPEATAQYRS